MSWRDLHRLQFRVLSSQPTAELVIYTPESFVGQRFGHFGCRRSRTRRRDGRGGCGPFSVSPTLDVAASVVMASVGMGAVSTPDVPGMESARRLLSISPRTVNSLCFSPERVQREIPLRLRFPRRD